MKAWMFFLALAVAVWFFSGLPQSQLAMASGGFCLLALLDIVGSSQLTSGQKAIAVVTGLMAIAVVAVGFMGQVQP